MLFALYTVIDIHIYIDDMVFFHMWCYLVTIIISLTTHTTLYSYKKCLWFVYTRIFVSCSLLWRKPQVVLFSDNYYIPHTYTLPYIHINISLTHTHYPTFI